MPAVDKIDEIVSRKLRSKGVPEHKRMRWGIAVCTLRALLNEKAMPGEDKLYGIAHLLLLHLELVFKKEEERIEDRKEDLFTPMEYLQIATYIHTAAQ